MGNNILEKMAKVELHCHLDGSIRTPTIIDLARMQEHHLPADTVEELRNYVRVPLDCRSLSDFLKRFEVFYPLLKNSYALERITYELCRDCAAENVKYLETRFAPVLQKTDSMPIPMVVEAVLKGAERGMKDYPIQCGIILCLYRGTSLEDSIETAECAVKMKNMGVCGIDIAGDESRYPLKDFIEPVKMCRDEGVNITIHAGEAAGPQYIREAIEMGADRIGHGITLIKDEKLTDEVAHKGIPLEICITSNIHTQTVEDYEKHPFRELMNKGVIITLNTDDRCVSGIDLTYEFSKARDLGISIDKLKEITLSSIEAAFVDIERKRELKEEIIRENNDIQ